MLIPGLAFFAFVAAIAAKEAFVCCFIDDVAVFPSENELEGLVSVPEYLALTVLIFPL